jgi:hypothetical protein
MEMSDVRGRQATFDDTVTKMQGKIRICRGDMGTRCLFSALVVIMMAASLLVACSGRTSYYATFSRRVKQLDFTFEYPRQWWVTPVEQYSDLVKVNIVDAKTSENESAVAVFVHVWLGLGSQAEQEAQDRLSESISFDKQWPNFKLVRQGGITLDGYGGYEVEYTHDAVSSWEVPPALRFYIPTRVLNIAIPRNGMVYEIWISTSQNEWNAREKDIQHILDTFRWK